MCVSLHSILALHKHQHATAYSTSRDYYLPLLKHVCHNVGMYTRSTIFLGHHISSPLDRQIHDSRPNSNIPILDQHNTSIGITSSASLVSVPYCVPLIIRHALATSLFIHYRNNLDHCAMYRWYFLPPTSHPTILSSKFAKEAMPKTKKGGQ